MFLWFPGGFHTPGFILEYVGLWLWFSRQTCPAIEIASTRAITAIGIAIDADCYVNSTCFYRIAFACSASMCATENVASAMAALLPAMFEHKCDIAPRVNLHAMQHSRIPECKRHQQLVPIKHWIRANHITADQHQHIILNSWMCPCPWRCHRP